MTFVLTSDDGLLTDDDDEPLDFSTRAAAEDKKAELNGLFDNLEVEQKGVEEVNPEIIDMSTDGGNNTDNDGDSDDDDNAESKWDDISISIRQWEGALSIEMSGDGVLAVSQPWQPLYNAETRVPIVVHHPNIDDNDDDEAERTAIARMSLSPDTARELGEWLIEHADDEPESVDGPAWGDGDE